MSKEIKTETNTRAQEKDVVWPRCKGGKRCGKKAVALIVISAQSFDLATRAMKPERIACYCCADHGNRLASQDQDYDLQPFVKRIKLLNWANITETLSIWPTS